MEANKSNTYWSVYRADVQHTDGIQVGKMAAALGEIEHAVRDAFPAASEVMARADLSDVSVKSSLGRNLFQCGLAAKLLRHIDGARKPLVNKRSRRCGLCATLRSRGNTHRTTTRLTPSSSTPKWHCRIPSPKELPVSCRGRGVTSRPRRSIRPALTRTDVRRFAAVARHMKIGFCHTRSGGPWHNNYRCPLGEKVDPPDRVRGRGGRPPCEQCRALDQQRAKDPATRRAPRARITFQH